MVFMLGKHFPDTQLVRKALTSLYGISGTSTTLSATASRAPAALPTVLHAHAAASASASASASTTKSKSATTSKSSQSSKSTSTSTSSSSPPPLAATAPLSPKRHNLLSRLLAAHYIHPTARLGDVSETRLTALTASLAELTIEMDLRRRVREDIARLRDMGSYRGRRHALGLPVRGQKTKGQTNTARKLNRIERRG